MTIAAVELDNERGVLEKTRTRGSSAQSQGGFFVTAVVLVLSLIATLILLASLEMAGASWVGLQIPGN